jgi:hypothetical protein
VCPAAALALRSRARVGLFTRRSRKYPFCPAAALAPVRAAGSLRLARRLPALPLVGAERIGVGMPNQALEVGGVETWPARLVLVRAGGVRLGQWQLTWVLHRAVVWEVHWPAVPLLLGLEFIRTSASNTSREPAGRDGGWHFPCHPERSEGSYLSDIRGTASERHTGRIPRVARLPSG